MYIGGNEEAARVVGIRISLLRIFNYTLVSTMAGVSAVLRASTVGGTTAGLTGPTFALIAIAAVIIGGASLRGGSGSVVGSFLGVIILTLLYNIMNLAGIDPFYNELTIGTILLISVFFDEFLKKRLVEMRDRRNKSRR
jgi:ribose/xylose/arabinose/galactoside ABC-type transport system permease subunit